MRDEGLCYRLADLLARLLFNPQPLAVAVAFEKCRLPIRRNNEVKTAEIDIHVRHVCMKPFCQLRTLHGRVLEIRRVKTIVVVSNVPVPRLDAAGENLIAYASNAELAFFRQEL